MVFVLVVVLVVMLGVGGFFAYKKFFASAAPEQLPGAEQQATAVQPGEAAPGGEQPAMEGQPLAPGSEQSAQTPVPASGYASAGGSAGSARTSTPQYSSESSAPPAADLPPAESSAPEAAPEPEPPPPPVREQRRVEILKPETRIPPAAPRSTAPPAQAAYTGPPSGIILWSGQLDKNGSVTIDGNEASFGNLTGQLPGVPVMIEVDQREFALAEAPSPSNGWKRITIRSRSKRHSVVTIKWSIL